MFKNRGRYALVTLLKKSRRLRREPLSRTIARIIWILLD